MKSKKGNVIRVSPKYFTGTEKGDESLFDFLGGIGALGGEAKEIYDEKQRDKCRRPGDIEESPS